MLVLMKHTQSIQMAYKSPIKDICAVCKQVIPQGEYLTRHMAPDPKRYNTITRTAFMVPYIACSNCAPYTQLEQHTGEMDLRELAARAQAENEETEVMLPVVRASTPRLPVVRPNDSPVRVVFSTNDLWRLSRG